MARSYSFRDPSRITRQLTLTVAGAAVFICLMLFLRGPLMADPQAKFFFKAQQLQAQGLTELALKHYRLISDLHPESAYAPAALKAQADIVTGLARKTGDPAQFQEAITLYRRMADVYGSDRSSGDSLLMAASIAKEDLNDRTQTREILKLVLERFPNNATYISQATLKLGRLALDEGQKDEAKTLLQRVLQSFPRMQDACAEAQYHLGVLYETLFKKKQAAEDAYRATFERYPRTIWASNAQQRLGMLIFQSSDKNPERLVLIEVQPVPDDGDGDDGILEAMRPLLAARGLSFDANILRGWSLEPFWAGFDPNRPGRVLEAPFSAFNNVASNANLLFDRRQGGDEKSALSLLQRELDAARPVIIYNGAWRLVVGYDSENQEVFVQSRGARVQAWSVQEFLESWKKKAPDAGPFTLMTFYSPDEKTRITRLNAAQASKVTAAIVRGTPMSSLAKTSSDAIPTLPPIAPFAAEPTPTPVPTPVPLGLTPVYVFRLKPLSLPDAHRRALGRAVMLMRRARVGSNETALLNLDALDAVATALERVAKAPEVSIGDESPVQPPVSPVPLPEGEALNEEALATPTTAPQPTPTLSSEGANVPATQKMERTRQLAQWFRGPLQSWVSARRDAASYLDSAANSLRRAQLKQAAANLRLSVKELSTAASLMPTLQNLEENGTLSESARRALLEAATHVRAARAAEARAVDQMDF